MKILCLIDGLSYGGAERQLIGLAYVLKNKGYEVDLCSYLKRDFYNELIKSYNLHAICLDVKGGKLSKFLAVRNYIKKGNYDCVIAFKDGPTFGTCCLKLLGAGFKLIVSERNTIQVLNRHEKIKFWLYWYADYIVPNSYSQEKFIKVNFPHLSKKVFCITNYTDTDFFFPIEKPINSIRSIVVVARIAKQKNIIRFLKAVRLLKDMALNFHVTWYGNVNTNEEGYQKDCMSLYEYLEISDTIDFRPATTDIREVYRNSDIFCLPSIYEGYPNVICEAMSCGKPILCSNVCDNPRIVSEGLNGLMFNPFNEDDMASVIKKMLMFDNERLIQMGHESRKLSLYNFASEIFAEQYSKLIEDQSSRKSE